MSKKNITFFTVILPGLVLVIAMTTIAIHACGNPGEHHKSANAVEGVVKSVDCVGRDANWLFVRFDDGRCVRVYIGESGLPMLQIGHKCRINLRYTCTVESVEILEPSEIPLVRK